MSLKGEFKAGDLDRQILAWKSHEHDARMPKTSTDDKFAEVEVGRDDDASLA